MESRYDFKPILVDKRYFRLQPISEMCETTIPKLQMDFTICVVHAHESRLSINEDHAGIGYARQLFSLKCKEKSVWSLVMIIDR